nr:AAA family ATPase [Leucobacter manosquensis]
MSKGGFGAFRGSAQTAESYLLERDSDRLDDYYREGQERTVEHGSVGVLGVEIGELTPEQFRAWMEHRDPITDEVRGTFRQRTFINSEGLEEVGGTPLYQETIISVDKTLSIAAAADPEIAAVLERAMSRGCEQAAAAIFGHAVTRIGPKGSQRQVKLDRVEYTSVQHATSRAGDPHFHRHMQILPVGKIGDSWRALDGRTLYRLAARVNQAADLTIATDVELRQVLAAKGLTWEPAPGGGRIVEYADLVDAHSQRRDQVATNREALEVSWRMAHPGQEPGPRQRQAWDTHGWAQERPSKEPTRDMTPEGIAARIATVEPSNSSHRVAGQTADQIDPRVIAEGALEDLSRAHSAWSAADMQAAIDGRLQQTYLIGAEGLSGLRSAALDAVMERSVNFLDHGVTVEGVRHFTSDYVLAVDERLTDALTNRALIPGENGTVNADRGEFTLSEAQQFAAEAIAGTHELVVVQGAAGAGKTTMLEAAQEALARQGRRMVAVSPTKRGALEAGDVLGVDGESVHALLYRAGAHVDMSTGRWVLPKVWREQPEHLRMDERTVLVVDEAGMLDQDTAAALHAYIDSQHVGSLVLTGDAAQLSAVGRGGYLNRAAQLAGVSLDLDDVRRFRTPEGDVDEQYAQLSLQMREREDAGDAFDQLVARGLVKIGTPEEQLERVADTVALETRMGRSSIVVTSTNAAAQQVNHAVFNRLVNEGLIDTAGYRVIGRDGDPIAAGVKIATRENDRELGVANRMTWTVRSVNEDGRVTVFDESGRHRTLDAEYVAQNVQLAYAVTTQGAQGMTVDTAHMLLSDETAAAGAYVGMTRGRDANVLHAVAYDLADARQQFIDAFERDSADLGLDAARAQVARDLTGLVTDDSARITEYRQQLEAEAVKHEQKAQVAEQHAADLDARVTAYEKQAKALLDGHRAADRGAAERVAEAEQAHAAWEKYAEQTEAETAQVALTDGREVLEARARVDDAAAQVQAGNVFTRRGLERQQETITEQWQQVRERAQALWGGAPGSKHELQQWVTRASKQHPRTIEARQNVERARGGVGQATTDRMRQLAEHRQETDTLRSEVIGTYPKRNALGNEKTVPLDEQTAAQWAKQHRQNAAEHRDQAHEARGEASKLGELTPQDAAQRIADREAVAPAEQSRTEQVFAEMQARREAQQHDRDRDRVRGIGW